MADDRIRDRITVAPRAGASAIAGLNTSYRGTRAEEILAAVLGERIVGKVALVSSFGADSAVLLHMAAQIDPAVPVLFLDTGKHFAETLAYRDLLTLRLGLRNIITLTPDAGDLAQRDATGLRWSYDPDGCCELRKVRPLERALVDYDATISGRKAFQASTRANLPFFEPDGASGRIKVNPLARWSAEDLATYAARHELTPHPLVAQGYPSIGCAPCTSKVQPGEDPRAGRWRGWDKVECGLHSPGGGPVARSDGSDDPVF